MGMFNNEHLSHAHSLTILNTLNEYDSFLDNLRSVADMGAGAGLDSQWWATLHTRDDPPEHREYTVYAVDTQADQIDKSVLQSGDIVPLRLNFEQVSIGRKVDLIWSHDSFQYVRNPFQCLSLWKETLNVNGMLVMAVPQTTYIDQRNRLVVTNHSHQYYSYNLLNLMYMLAISGFDCRDAYFYRESGTPWLYAAVYASEHGPLPGATWYDLAERLLINDSVINSVVKYGHARLEDVVVNWLDKNFYQITN